MSDEKLRELVITAMGGIDAVKRIAEMPDLPVKMQPDTLRDLARYLLREDEDD